MAQHYLVPMEIEVEVRKSIERVGRYISKSSWLRLRHNCEKDSVYEKDIMSLPREYYAPADGFVITIGPYNLKRTRKMWGEYWKQANLEVHFTKSGRIIKVYLPL